jgi:peptidylprolyl isomerase
VRDSAIVESYLQAISVPPANYPDDAEVQKTYDANQSAFIVPRQFRIAQIFVAAAEGNKTAADQARKKLTDIQARLKQRKADFAAIAKEMSDHRETAERAVNSAGLRKLRSVQKSRLRWLACPITPLASRSSSMMDGILSN